MQACLHPLGEIKPSTLPGAIHLAGEHTRAVNRLRSLLTQIHPALERVFAGSSLSTALVLDLLEKYARPDRVRSCRAWERVAVRA